MNKLKLINEKDFENRVSLSLKEAKETSGLSTGHFRNEAKRGRIKLLKSDRRTIVMASELQRYLSELPEIASA